LLLAFDPLLTAALFVLLLMGGSVAALNLFTVSLLFCLYVFSRFLLNRRAKQQIIAYLNQEGIKEDCENLVIIPTIHGLHRWDFTFQTKSYSYLGHVNILRHQLVINEKLPRSEHQLIDTAWNCDIGKFFADFTSFAHTSCTREGDNFIVRFFDLRYYINRNFLYSAVAVYNANYELIQTNFIPYSKAKLNKNGCN